MNRWRPGSAHGRPEAFASAPCSATAGLASAEPAQGGDETSSFFLLSAAHRPLANRLVPVEQERQVNAREDDGVSCRSNLAKPLPNVSRASFMTAR
jgi:hypothetical protein